MASPPLEEGAVHCTTALRMSAEAVTSVGAPGTVARTSGRAGPLQPARRATETAVARGPRQPTDKGRRHQPLHGLTDASAARRPSGLRASTPLSAALALRAKVARTQPPPGVRPTRSAGPRASRVPERVPLHGSPPPGEARPQRMRARWPLSALGAARAGRCQLGARPPCSLRRRRPCGAARQKKGPFAASRRPRGAERGFGLGGAARAARRHAAVADGGRPGRATGDGAGSAPTAVRPGRGRIARHLAVDVLRARCALQL
jgi:hypothetical protein